MTEFNKDIFYSLVKDAFKERWQKGINITSTCSTPFRCEADLQFCLASKLEKTFKNAGVYLEYRIKICGKNKCNFSHPIDIVLVLDKKKYIIELKYSAYDYRNNKRRHFAGTENCTVGFQEDIDLVKALLEKANVSGYLYDKNENKYDGENNVFEKGFCLFLTNQRTRLIEFEKNPQLKISDEIQDEILGAPFKLIIAEI